MEWAFGAFFAVMFALYIWASYTAKRNVSKRIQPFVDDLLDSHPQEKHPTDSQLPK